MHVQALEASLFFCIFCLGLFLGAGVRPLLVAAMHKEPGLIGPILTAMFSRYNLVALAFSGVSLILEALYAPSLIRLLPAAALTLVLGLKLPVDHAVKRRESSGQVRGVGDQGKQLDRLHQLVEGATVAVLFLAFASFILSLTGPGKT